MPNPVPAPEPAAMRFTPEQLEAFLRSARGGSKMPRPGSRDAPRFSSVDPKELPRYIERMEDVFKDYGVTDGEKKKKYICDFADAVSAEEWKSMKTYMEGTYDDFVTALPKRYGELRHHKEGSLLELKRELRSFKGIESDDMSQVLALNRTMQRHTHKLLRDPANLSITSGGLAKLYLEYLSPTFRQAVKQAWMVWQTTPDGQAATKGRRVDDPWTVSEIMESAEKVAANGQLFEEEEVELISGPLFKNLTKDTVKKESQPEFLTVAKLLVE
ncbi:hypothetical protein DXG01_007055 [Tephrocybe rancida]|nr:hypothetical protein DXG01_007055 [Tephrocybe rancida]